MTKITRCMIEIKRRSYNFMLQFFVTVLRTVPPSRVRLIRRDVQTITANESSPLAQVEARSAIDTDSFLQNLEARWPSLKHVRGVDISSLNHSSPSNLVLLDQCILMIFWEEFDIDCRDICQIVGTPDDLVLLCAAAKTDTVGCLLYP
jgi:hypothetical protein